MRMLVIILGFTLPCLATDYTVTTGADTVVNGQNFQSVLTTNAACGDTVILTAGATYDGSFTLADKNCTAGTPITIRSSAVASLPNGRVNPSYASNMAKVRTLGNGTSGEIFYINAGAEYWIIDGLEMTDNGPDATVISSLINAPNATTANITVKRSWLHNKETGSTYNRSIRWGIQFEGSGLTFTQNYVEILGYYKSAVGLGNFAPIDTIPVGCVGCNTVLLENNYFSFWYAGFFTGGGGSTALNSANLTSSSTTSATFDNITGLATGGMLRFDLEGAGSCSVSGGNMLTLTRSSGVTPTAADEDRPMQVIDTSSSNTGNWDIDTVSGNTITAIGKSGNWTVADDCTFTIYETALIDSVNGSTVNYTAFGHDALTSGAGAAPASAAWNYGDQGLVYDFTVRRNTFYVDPDFAADVLTNNGNGPKGFFESKNAKRMIIEGNYFLGHPAVLAWTGANQYGDAPWITVSDTTIRNNWIAPNQHATGGNIIIYSDNQYINSNLPSKNVDIYNNLILHVRNVMAPGEIDNVSIYHNTFVNDGTGSGGYNSVVAGVAVMASFEFRDNIVSYRGNGMQCFVDPFTLATCYPSGVFDSNVVVDDQANGFASTVWGAGGILTPIPTAFSGVGFTDAASGNYTLLVSSDYKGMASDSTDPGVDFPALLEALQGEPPSSSTGRFMIR